jgi:biotin-dependent carboxylase-like uncharacterized protein
MTSSNERFLKIVQPGPMSLVQDRGRSGFQQLGVSVSGAVDADALDVGNRLVGNDLNAAALEVMLGGLVVQFTEPTMFTLTGSDTGATLDGVPVSTNVSYLAHADATLQMGIAQGGLRSYLSVGGGFELEQVLDSRSTHSASAIGGLEGRALVEGNVLPIGIPNSEAQSGNLLESQITVASSTELNIRIVLGPQDNEFSTDGIETLLNSSYSVTDQSNRQGLRLDGPIVESLSGRYDIISDAVVNGSIQIPGDGKPIILLADRQTTGGYAKIATVATVDLPKLGQATPGTTISFEAISVENAQALLAARHQAILEAPLEKVVDPTTLKIDDVEVSVGVAENGEAMLAELDGSIYPISVVENIPAE